MFVKWIIDFSLFYFDSNLMIVWIMVLGGDGVFVMLMGRNENCFNKVFVVGFV